MMIPVPVGIRFRIVKENILPVLVVSGIGPKFPGVKEVLLSRITELFEMGEKFGGRGMELNSAYIEKVESNEIFVAIQMIFPDQSSALKAQESIDKELG